MSTFQNAFSKYTTTLSSGGSIELPRRSVFFELDREVAMSGVFDKDLVVELRSLTVAAELRASRGNGLQGASLYEMTMQLAFESIHSVDGDVLNQGQKEWFWEVLGQAGRQVVVTAYKNLIGDSEDAQKKAAATLRIQG